MTENITHKRGDTFIRHCSIDGFFLPFDPDADAHGWEHPLSITCQVRYRADPSGMPDFFAQIDVIDKSEDLVNNTVSFTLVNYNTSGWPLLPLKMDIEFRNITDSGYSPGDDVLTKSSPTIIVNVVDEATEPPS